MRIAKTILTVLIVAVALAAAAVALFWERLLTPEQKMQYGLVFSATADYGRLARSQPHNTEALSDYAEALAVSGNLGRARYLCDLYGAHSATLERLQPVIELSVKAAANDQAYAVSDDEAVQAVAELPVAQSLRYLEGYQHALLGDWASARNHFAAIDEKKLAPALRPYWRYYLARSYRLAGNEEQREQLEELLISVASDREYLRLAAQAHYNLISWYLGEDYAGADGITSANAHLESLAAFPADWPLQKAYTEFAEYHIRQGEYAPAWENIQSGLLVDPIAQAGQRCGEVALDLLERLLDDEGAWGLDESGAVTLLLASGVFIDLADCAAQHGFTARAAVLLDRLKPHLAKSQRASWEELRVGLARCYRAQGDRAAMQALIADPNLRDLSDSRLGEIYFQHASLLQQDQAWNSALEYYKSAAELSEERAGESLLQCYAILKQVQDPLNLDRAVSYLGQVVESYSSSPALPKAVEELLPLLVYRGERQAARQLIDRLLQRTAPQDAPSPRQQDAAEQLLEVVHFWDAQLLEREGDAKGAAQARGKIPVKYWNYYELTSTYPPQPSLAGPPAILDVDETAAELLAGLGLADSAQQTAGGRDGPQRQVLAYLDLAYQQEYLPPHSLQWHATELLESGRIEEQALLNWVLPRAYPRLFEPEVISASEEFDVPPNLIWAVMKKESNFRPDAVSWAGAEGLMQVMPATARWLDDKYGLGVSGQDIADPACNIRLGTAYLASLLEIFGQGSIRAVIHAYNGGDGNFRKWRERYGGDQILLTELIPNEENETFGKKVIRYYKMYEWNRIP